MLFRSGGNVSLRAQSISSEVTPIITNGGGSTEQFSVVADRIENVQTGSSTIAIGAGNGQISIRAPKVTGYVTISGGGAVRFDGCGIDSTGRAQPTVNLTGTPGSLTLANCVLVTDAGQTYSLGSTAARTVNVVGTLTANKAIDPDVTFAGPGTVIASGNTVYMGGKVMTAGLGTLSTVSPTGTPDGTKFLRDDNSYE